MARHAKSERTRNVLACALAACGLAAPAAAQTLGALDVRSPVGQPLDATVALGSAAGAPVTADCIFLSRGSPEDGPFITRAQVAVFDEAGERFARLRSTEPVSDPTSRLRIVVRCAGQPYVAYREYRGLFDPRPAEASTPSPPVISASSPAEAPRHSGPGLQVRPGDTMASLAALLFPRDGATQRAYVQALREANPALASLGPADAIPLDANVVLPDLRALPRMRPEPSVALAPAPRPPAPKAAAPSPPAEPVPAPRKLAGPPPKAPRTTPPKSDEVAKAPSPPLVVAKEAPAPKTAPKAAPRRPIESGERVVLRLSSPEVDLTRSRNIDDATRAKLRERLLVLDNDDQVAALLQLRDSLKRLEGRVAELQLKLSGMPSSMPAAPASPPPPVKALPPPKVEVVPPKVEPPKVEAKVEAPKVVAEPPKVEAKVEPPKVEPPKVEPPKVEPPKAEVKVDTPVVEATRAAPKPAPPMRPAKAAEPSAGVPLWIWAALAGGALLLALLAWWWLRRPRVEEEDELPRTMLADSEPPPVTEPPEVAHDEHAIDIAEPVAVAAAPSRRREIDSDATLATEVRGTDPAALRRRYMEERFPEIATGSVVLSDPDSVIKAARLLYEDGAIPRSVELLQFATEEHPQEQRTWLALFEVYRLERLAVPFSDLAQRFRDLHGKGENWRKVQFFGREVDPGNALYRDLAVGIETIKFEAGKPPVPVSYDPISENWLNAPMDFENELLAVELRRALMDREHLTDDDLVPNPMPALRSVEMFTVA